jgi:transcriptional regulator with XRE-family HTH domain
MVIGERLKELRKQKQISQGDIEKRTGLLRCYISRVENGHTVPSVDTLEKMARALEVPMYRLFTRQKAGRRTSSIYEGPVANERQGSKASASSGIKDGQSPDSFGASRLLNLRSTLRFAKQPRLPAVRQPAGTVVLS